MIQYELISEAYQAETKDQPARIELGGQATLQVRYRHILEGKALKEYLAMDQEKRQATAWALLKETGHKALVDATDE